MTTQTLQIKGMHCASCVSTVENGLRKLGGVAEADVNLALARAMIQYDPARVSPELMIKQVRSLGYDASAGEADLFAAQAAEAASAFRTFLIAALATLPLVILAMGPMVFGQFVPAHTSHLLQAGLASFVVLVAGFSILKDGIAAAVRLRSNMNTLISLGVLAAFGWSCYQLLVAESAAGEAGGAGAAGHELYFESAAVIIMFVSLGRWLEAIAKRSAGDALAGLMSLTPKHVTVMVNKFPIQMEATAVRVGMELLVRPGERVAVDGIITSGSPLLDNSALTGESVPVESAEGDLVLSGAVNTTIPFRMRATKELNESFLAQVIRFVSEAQSGKPGLQKLADRVASIFVPIVLVVALLTGIGWIVFAPGNPDMISCVIAVLIIACPCALGLATPTAILVASGTAARERLLVRNGDLFERLARVSRIVFDKTGTVTQGDQTVVAIWTADGIAESDLLTLAASVEGQAEHSIARAIVAAATERKLSIPAAESVVSATGLGISGVVNGRKVRLGRSDFLSANQIDLTAAKQFLEVQHLERTVILIAADSRLIGALALSDTIRAEAESTISQLARSRSLSLLSGDREEVVARVAARLSIGEHFSQIDPAGKKRIIESYQAKGEVVAMVGDGINDAPALTQADVGIALSTGTDIAQQSADAVVVGQGLTGVLKLCRLSAHTVRLIKQNLFWAFAYNVIAIPLAAGLLYPSFGWKLSPMIAALAMSLSSVIVVLNALRIRSIDPGRD